MDTQDFFKKVQAELNERRYNMGIITDLHGWTEIQDMYKKGQHGALTDAFVLAQLWVGKKSSLRIWYGEWLAVDRR